MTRKEIIDSMLKDGAELVTGLTIRSVNINPNDNYTGITLSVDAEVNAYLPDENKAYVKSKSSLIFTSTYSLASLFKDVPQLAFAADYIIDNPMALKCILCGSKCDIIQQEVVKDGEDNIIYTNPFSTKNSEYVITHSTYVTDVVKLDISDDGKQDLRDIRRFMLGIH